jgi:topoisomerase-4 subunit A
VLADIRDESAEDIRIVLEPKSRRLEAEVVMESLFKLTDFEVRVPLNLNVSGCRWPSGGDEFA